MKIFYYVWNFDIGSKIIVDKKWLIKQYSSFSMLQVEWLNIKKSTWSKQNSLACGS